MAGEAQTEDKKSLSREQVQKLAELVYGMMRADAAIGLERRGEILGWRR